MRIALRTSGGRGEYEVAGSQDTIGVSDVVDHEITLQLFPGSGFETGNVIRRVQGKPRIRLADKGFRHLYLVLADSLLLPKPKREVSKTPGGKVQLTDDNFSVSSIQFDVVGLTMENFAIQPTNLLISNSDDSLARLDVLERLRILLDVWSCARARFDHLGLLVRDHSDAIEKGVLDQIKTVASSIRRWFGNGDPLREIVREFGIADQFSYWAGVHSASQEDVLDDDPTPHVMAIEKRVREWRLQVSRGAAGRKFSSEVKAAYNHTCAFTGDFLPKSSYVSQPGVDSAHILPWSRYDVNSVQNGLCLNKLCHWAFDQGVLRLDYADDCGRYILSIGDRAKKAAKEGLISIAPFELLEGIIPIERLPSNRDNWPNPAFLKRYNESLPS